MKTTRKSKLSRRRELRKQKKNTKVSLLIVLALALLLFLPLFIFWKVYDIDKFTYVNKTDDGSAEIIIVDTDSDKVIRYLIASDTQLDSAREYGNYKMVSLWNLSKKEDNSGSLITETITKNYFIPIYLWKNNTKSNLNVYQRIKSFLIEKKSSGYDDTFKSSKLPNSILINFVNPEFSENIPTVNIEDLTGSYDTAQNVSKIVEIMGGKITLNSKGYDENFDCVITSKDLSRAKIFASVLNCNFFEDKSITTDVKISLGAKFAKRF